MAQFHLRYGQRDLEVPPGDFLIGRARGCHLILDDPMVSRRHAIFRATAETLRVVDLNSSNGVYVNGERISGPVQLRDGDSVLIGEQLLRVRLGTAQAPSAEPAFLPDAELEESAGENATTLNSLGAFIEGAVKSGEIDEAEKIVAGLLNRTMVGLEQGRLGADSLPTPTRYALRLAAETGRTSWLDWIFRAHHTVDAVLPATTVDELHVVARKIRYPVTPVLRAYVDGLSARADRLGPSERFALQRTQGLLRTLLA